MSPQITVTKGQPTADQLAALTAIVTSAASTKKSTGARTPQTRRLVADLGREFHPVQFPHLRFY